MSAKLKPSPLPQPKPNSASQTDLPENTAVPNPAKTGSGCWWQPRWWVLAGLVVVIGLLLFTRMSWLDNQAFHHDESIHCFYSWKIAHESPTKYRYDPVYHGPFLYHWGALFQTLLADTDAAARMPYATIGVLLVLLFLLWRRQLGWRGTLLVMALLTASPSLTYFSRFARNDVYQSAWLAGLIVFTWQYLTSRRLVWLNLAVLFLVLSYSTKENFYINCFFPGLFLVGYLAYQTIRSGSNYLRSALSDYLPLARILILLGCFSVFTFSYVALDTRVSPQTGIVNGIRNIVTHSTAIHAKTDASRLQGEHGFFSQTGQDRQRRCFWLWALGTTMVLLVLAELAASRTALWWQQGLHVVVMTGWYLLAGGMLIGLAKWIGSASGENFWKALSGQLLTRGGWLLLASAGVALLQAFIPRCSPKVSAQPHQTNAIKSFVVMWLPLGTLVLQLGIVVTVFLTLFSSLGTNLPKGPIDGLYQYLGYWFKHQTGDYRIWGVWWYYLPRLLLYESLPLLLLLFCGGDLLRQKWQIGRKTKPSLSPDPDADGVDQDTKHLDHPPALSVPPGLLWFSLGLLVYFVMIYLILNEKVPWLVTYQAFALNLSAALVAAQWVSRCGANCPWRSLRTKAAIGVVVLATLFHFWQHTNAVFLRPDHPAELLVYTQTTHAFKQQANRVQQLAQTASENDQPFKVAVQGKSEWPLAWYFRNLDVRWKTIDLTRDVQFMDDTTAHRHRIRSQHQTAWELEPVWLRAWWIWHGDATGLPGQLRLFDNLRAFLKNQRNDHLARFPKEQRPPAGAYHARYARQIWDYVFFRKIWYPTAGERVLVAYRSGEPVPDEQLAAVLDGSTSLPVILQGEISITPQQRGSARFRQPRGLSLTPEGNLVVVDSHHGRVLVVDESGKLLQTIGEGDLSTQVTGPGDVVCDAEGSFFVADTWNHAIRKYSPEGVLLKTVTSFGEGVHLFGPRGIAIGPGQQVYVTDTGNHTVRVYNQELEPLYSWGARGNGPGEVIEPVGIACAGGRVYVADTGNGRIQAFGPNGQYLEHWFTFLPEENQVVQMEPHLGVLPDGRIVQTISLTSNVWVIDPNQKNVVIYRITKPNLTSPTGVAVDGVGRVWIGDRSQSALARLIIPPAK